jgi:hypothetical protein
MWAALRCGRPVVVEDDDSDELEDVEDDDDGVTWGDNTNGGRGCVFQLCNQPSITKHSDQQGKRGRGGERGRER